MTPSDWAKARPATRELARRVYGLRTQRYKWREIGELLELTEARARQLAKIFAQEFEKTWNKKR